MHELLVNRLFKIGQGKVWLGELTVPPMTIAVDWDVKQQNIQTNDFVITLQSTVHLQVKCIYYGIEIMCNQ